LYRYGVAKFEEELAKGGPGGEGDAPAAEKKKDGKDESKDFRDVKSNAVKVGGCVSCMQLTHSA
jgi:hypothetical protein